MCALSVGVRRVMCPREALFLTVERFYQNFQCVFRKIYRVCRSLAVRDYDNLLYRIDVEYMPCVQNVFPSRAYEISAVLHVCRYFRLYFRQSEAYHEVCAG